MSIEKNREIPGGRRATRTGRSSERRGPDAVRRRAPGGRAFGIVATIGPASRGCVGDLVAAGATALRLNASHLSAVELAESLDSITRAAPGTPVVVDLQGAKMRLGAIAPFTVSPGDRVVFATSPGPGELALPHPELFAGARAGDTLSAGDDRLRFALSAVSPERAVARALKSGRLGPRQGVNLVEHPVELAELTAVDREAVAAGVRHGASAFAFSFMTDGREASWVRRAAPSCAVVGKVERREAARALPRLARAVDAVWICRGDLVAQVGPAMMARFVAGVRPRRLAKPVLMAGQVLEHLTAHAEPTRSEVCHLWDLVTRGYAGIVLSDETAIGADPVRAVTQAAALVAAPGQAASLEPAR